MVLEPVAGRRCPLIASVTGQLEYIVAVNPAPFSLSEPNESRRPMTALRSIEVAAVVDHGRERLLDEDG